jgi:hypothetical protein
VKFFEKKQETLRNSIWKTESFLKQTEKDYRSDRIKFVTHFKFVEEQEKPNIAKRIRKKLSKEEDNRKKNCQI